jgi:transposase
LHALADAPGRPITFFLTAGQTSGDIGARALLSFRPKARALLAGCGYDADRLRKALIEREIIPCIPGRKARKLPVEYDSELYKERRRIENMFGRRKD